MEKAKRGAMLRKAFKAAGGIAYTANGINSRPKTRPIPNNGPGKPLAVAFSVSLCERRSKWVSEPDPKLSNPGPAPKRANGVSALIRIAERYPRRLP